MHVVIAAACSYSCLLCFLSSTLDPVFMSFSPLLLPPPLSNQMQEVLKITPTDLEKTVIDTANSFIEQGIIKKSKKSLKKAKEDSDAANAPTEEGMCVSLWFSVSVVLQNFRIMLLMHGLRSGICGLIYCFQFLLPLSLPSFLCFLCQCLNLKLNVFLFLLLSP